MTRRRVLMAAITLVLGGAGCAIQPDSGPRDVPDDHPARVPVAPVADGGEAEGEGRIYLVAADADAQPLRTVLRDSTLPEQLLRRLIAGPNPEELDAGLTSELPTTLEVLSARFDGGVMNIDLSDDINELTGDRLRRGIAQMVFTASEIPGTESVVIRVEGETQAWPNGDGEAQATPLTVYDFTGYAESSQPAYPVTPAVSPTTTATTAATLTTTPALVS